MEAGEREIIYLSLHCHHQNDFCIKMGSDESHFNVSVGSDGQSQKTMSTNHNPFEEKGEPKRYRTEVLPLTSLTPYRWAKPAHTAHTGSHRVLGSSSFWSPWMLSKTDVKQDLKKEKINNNTLYSSQWEIKAVVRSHNEEHISVILSHVHSLHVLLSLRLGVIIFPLPLICVCVCVCVRACVRADWM